jgi:hemerythrin
MSLINWSDSMSIGLPEVDDQHKKLVGIVNALHDAMLKGHARDVMGRLLDEVIDYTVYHFGTEERLFKEKSYPGAADHKAKHDELTSTAKKLRADVASGKTIISHQVMRFLRDWLSEHILSDDMKFGKWSQGAK